MRVLDGIKVLDFGRYIAGPYCAALLGDLGADVIRIEKREGSEDRYLLPLTPGKDGATGDGAMFMQMNRNKRSLTLDPMTEEGRRIAHRLAEEADVVIANLPPATLKAMGLDYATLFAINPRIILTTVSAFGSTGPYADRVGFDGIAQAMCGAVYLSGTPEQPIKSYAPWVDFGTASLAAFGTMAALYARAQTGRGQEVQGALLSTALTFFNFHLIEQAILKTDRVATLNRSQNSGPSDLFRAKDGFVQITINGEPLFRRWAKLLGEPEWIGDPRFASDQARGDNGEALSARMQRWFSERSVAEALSALEAARIPAGPVYSPQQALDDGHVKAMGLFQDVNYPGLGLPAPVAGTPVSLSLTPGELRRRPPMLGEHTDEILAAIGIGAEEIARLRAANVV
ncbi:MAG: CoA transferase [Alphaproteobacteria bacterium]|nr:CoA transferase [Alphaproteobacteria bacterium]